MKTHRQGGGLLIIPEEGMDETTLDRLESILDDVYVLGTEIVLREYQRALSIETSPRYKPPATFEWINGVRCEVTHEPS